MAKSFESKTTGITFKVRPLTRGEIRKLREQGVDIFNFDSEAALRNIDPILDMVFPGNLNLDNLPFQEATLVYRAIMEETFGTEDEVKNS